VTRRAFLVVVLALVVSTVSPRLARAADERRDIGPDPQQLKEVLEKAADYLKSHQGEDGSFSPRIAGPGVTAVVVAGMLRCGFRVDDAVLRRALPYLEKSAKPDGGIYDKGLANYTTSVAIMALKEANQDGKYDTLIKKAAAYLKKLQHAESEDDVRFGGVGYDKKSRPDLSNTQYFIDAMLAAGVSKDDPAIKRALKFVSRCQNLPGETNDQPFAKKTRVDWCTVPIPIPTTSGTKRPTAACARWEQ
jgi:hypothetical protein